MVAGMTAVDDTHPAGVGHLGQCLLSALRLLDVALVERSAGTPLAFFAARTGGRPAGRTSVPNRPCDPRISSATQACWSYTKR